MNKNTEQGVPACLVPGFSAWHVVLAAHNSPITTTGAQHLSYEAVSFRKEIQRTYILSIFENQAWETGFLASGGPDIGR